jgi:hypothetical protein
VVEQESTDRGPLLVSTLNAGGIKRQTNIADTRTIACDAPQLGEAENGSQYPKSFRILGRRGYNGRWHLSAAGASLPQTSHDLTIS